MRPTLSVGPARRLGALVLAAILALTGCSSGPPPPDQKLAIGGVEMSEPEFLYGMDVNPDPSVTLADDVVVVPNGSQTVRSVTGDGLTWTLDPEADGVKTLQVGQVMFLTSRGVGRVAAIEDTGEGLNVTIAPVEITEVITEGDFGGEELALDASNMISYDTGEQPWTVSDLEPSEEGDDGAEGFAPVDASDLIRLAVDAPNPDVSRRPKAPNPNWGGAAQTSAGDFTIHPVCCTDGVGVRISYNRGGLDMTGTLRLVGTQPKASWHLSISGGKVQRAEMQVSGAAGIAYEFSAHTSSGIEGNIHKRVTLPTTLSVPAVAAGVPFVLTVQQEFIVRTAFSAKTGSLSASGQWSFGGGLAFGYTGGGGFAVRNPGGVQLQKSLTDSIQGVSVGASGMVLAHRVELKVGIGWSVFNVGPYVDVVSSIGVTRGSDLGGPLVICRGASLNVWAGAGISYRLPQVVVDIVNFILDAVRAKRIASEGALVGVRVDVAHPSVVAPAAKICGEG